VLQNEAGLKPGATKQKTLGTEVARAHDRHLEHARLQEKHQEGFLALLGKTDGIGGSSGVEHVGDDVGGAIDGAGRAEAAADFG
jgi:hypothetical protein